MLNESYEVGVDLASAKDKTIKTLYHKGGNDDITQYYHTFSVNPYICKLCGRKGFANALILSNKKVGMGENIICEECALQAGIKIEDNRMKKNI